MSGSRWDQRIARAAELERSHPAAAELLHFYGELARFQRSVSEDGAMASLSGYVEPLLLLVTRSGPDALAQSAKSLLGAALNWERLVLAPETPAEVFCSRVLRQAYQETLARRSEVARTHVQPTCPFCSEHPVVAALRPEGDGGKRSLVCSLCFTEWEFRRILCPHCGEEDKDKLPVYTATEFTHIRVEACETCRTYLKSVDLTRDGRAVPEVDELGAVPLDLWAVQQGYTKLQPNLFGI